MVYIIYIYTIYIYIPTWFFHSRDHPTSAAAAAAAAAEAPRCFSQIDELLFYTQRNVRK